MREAKNCGLLEDGAGAWATKEFDDDVSPPMTTGLGTLTRDGSIAVVVVVVVDMVAESPPAVEELGATGAGVDDRGGTGDEAASSPR